MLPPCDAICLDSHESVSLANLSRACGMSTDELAGRVEYGAPAPLEPRAQ